MQVQIQQVPDVTVQNQQATLDAAVKTIPMSDHYGFTGGEEIVWPTVKDLQEMVKNLPTKIRTLKYQKSNFLNG
jgi:hypothetical protein